MIIHSGLISCFLCLCVQHDLSNSITCLYNKAFCIITLVCMYREMWFDWKLTRCWRTRLEHRGRWMWFHTASCSFLYLCRWFPAHHRTCTAFLSPLSWFLERKGKSESSVYFVRSSETCFIKIFDSYVSIKMWLSSWGHLKWFKNVIYLMQFG